MMMELNSTSISTLKRIGRWAFVGGVLSLLTAMFVKTLGMTATQSNLPEEISFLSWIRGFWFKDEIQDVNESKYAKITKLCYSTVEEYIQMVQHSAAIYIRSLMELIDGRIFYTIAMISFIVLLICIFSYHKYPSQMMASNSVTERCNGNCCSQVVSSPCSILHSWKNFTFIIIVVCSLLSLPWEFIRMYQNEVAKKSAVLYAGIPPECFPENMGMAQSFKFWLMWVVSWEHDPCKKYHYALMVDPVWEITPIMVLSSAFTRCIMKPLELVCSGIGQCLKLILTEVPLHWQPLVMTILNLTVVILLVMTCSYRISMPLLKIEPHHKPKSPQEIRYRKKRAQKMHCKSIEGTSPRKLNQEKT